MSILKWVGGKSQIMNDLIDIIPDKILTYYELFIGGASVLINIIELCEEKKITVENFVINDINTELINLYKNIKNSHLELIEELKDLDDKFKQLPELKNNINRQKINIPESEDEILDKTTYYYFIREFYNIYKIESKDLTVSKSACFIFLNKVGFRGLYRENSSNIFNVPYGNYKNPKIYDEIQIIRLNYLFNKYNVVFENKNFINVIDMKELKIGDFVYLDPPYYPIHRNSFTSYSSNDFGIDDHSNIISIIKKINDSGAKFLLSNSYTEWVVENTNKFEQKKIICKRRINSKNPNSIENEILVYN